MLRKNIFTAMCVPYLEDRYEKNSKLDYSLQDYVSRMQFTGETREHCYKVLDYLYVIYPNDKENANYHLQIAANLYYQSIPHELLLR